MVYLTILFLFIGYRRSTELNFGKCRKFLPCAVWREIYPDKFVQHEHVGASGWGFKFDEKTVLLVNITVNNCFSKWLKIHLSMVKLQHVPGIE
jgi:hypothetical protein